MHQSFEAPLSFSEILDVIFRIIKEHFIELFKIMLVLMGPLYLLQGIGMISGGVSLLRDPNRLVGISSLFGNFAQPGMEGTYDNLGIKQFALTTLSMLLLSFVSIPMANASMILATDRIRRNEPLNTFAIIKQAFSRYWPLLGGSILFGLTVFALFIGIAFLIIAYLIIVGGTGALTGIVNGFPTTGLGIHIIVAVILSVCSLALITYLTTRWSFFIPAIVFEEPGLRKSWKLTHGNFWRLSGLYIVVTIITGIISFVLQVAWTFFLGSSILAFLLDSLVSMLVTMIAFVAYAVIYFDLRVRNEADDLKAMIGSYQGTTSADNRMLENTNPEMLGQDNTNIDNSNSNNTEEASTLNPLNKQDDKT